MPSAPFLMPAPDRFAPESFAPGCRIPRRSPRAALLLAALAFFTCLPVQAADEPARDTSGASLSGSGKRNAFSVLGNKMREEILQMTEFFDTTIPGTLKKYNLVLGFSTRTSDIRSREFIRFPATIRYGLADNWEIFGGVTAFAPNPINSGKEHRWGPGEIRTGLRHNVGSLKPIFDSVTLALEGRSPVGEPPYEIIDHYTHVIPSINTSRRLPYPSTTLFMNFLYDASLDTPGRHPWPPPGSAHRNTFVSSAGLLYMPGEFGLSFEYSFRYFEDDSQGCHLGHQVRLGPIWDIPLWRTQSWGLPGKWQFELAGRVTTEEGSPVSQGVLFRVRWRTNLREVLSLKSYRRIPPPSTRFASE